MESSRDKLVAVFFTHGVSLELWEKRGMFSREVQFYKALADKLGVVHLFTYGRDDARYQKRLGERLVVHPKRLPLPDLLYGLLLPFLSWRLLRRVNAIRIHQTAGAIPAVLAHWLTCKPLIVRGGFQWYSFAKRQGSSKLKLSIISLIERLAYRCAHAIIHTTQADANFVAARYGVAARKLHAIPNWVDTDLFRPYPECHPSASKHEALPRICFVGRLEEQKNLFALIEAMRGLRAQLHVYGDGPSREPLREHARAMDVSVVFHGVVANDRLARCLCACDIFVLPSLYEGNPKVLLEAMACGLPVIGTNVEGIASVIEDSKTGILCETRPESIHQAITDLLADPVRRARLGAAAREFIVGYASLERALQTEVPLYDL
ncbi:glycosyltransferase family 4 protein [Candidatus Uhrbacteria bacterium]|nr:glycosyltransferase family 4 protein [Candidatus Uhrbacteria bacterium]